MTSSQPITETNNITSKMPTGVKIFLILNLVIGAIYLLLQFFILLSGNTLDHQADPCYHFDSVSYDLSRALQESALTVALEMIIPAILIWYIAIGMNWARQTFPIWCLLFLLILIGIDLAVKGNMNFLNTVLISLSFSAPLALFGLFISILLFTPGAKRWFKRTA